MEREDYKIQSLSIDKTGERRTYKIERSEIPIEKNIHKFFGQKDIDNCVTFEIVFNDNISEFEYVEKNNILHKDSVSVK